MSGKKEAIFTAALRLFSERGYAHTPISEVARAAGVAEGTVFYHFGTKSDLYIAILEDTRRLLKREFDRLYEQQEFRCGSEILEGVIMTYLTVALSLRERFTFLHRHDTHEIAEERRGCRRELKALYEWIIDVLEEPILKGVEDGSLRKVPVDRAALVLFSMLDGVIRLRSSDLYEPESLLGEVMDLCRHMLAPSGEEKERHE